MCKCTPAIRSFYCLSCVPHGKRLDGKSWTEDSVPSHVPPNNITRNNERCSDAVIEANVNMLRSRSDVGMSKYGQSVADNPADLRAWLQHALEETLDNANYLMRAIMEIDRNVNRS
ncbi:hypothetical protein [Achromobacter phage nyashin_LB6]|nr:hypothetical protein [Achromobacter phage nyashin_LB6]